MFLSALCLFLLTELSWQCQDDKIIQCPCGKSGNYVTICTEERLKLNDCENFRHCETCTDYATDCRSCPHGKSGSHCTEIETELRTRVCPDPGFVSNGYRLNIDGSSANLTKESFTVGSALVFSCKSGFALQGQSLIICLPTEVWSQELPQCEQITPKATCSRATTPIATTTPTTMAPTTLTTTTLASKTMAAITAMMAQLPLRTTTAPSTSTAATTDTITMAEMTTLISTTMAPPTTTEAPNSTKVYCKDQGPTRNGRRVEQSTPPYNYDQGLKTMEIEENQNTTYWFAAGIRIKYVCEEEYTLIGEETITCLITGFWSGTKPLCRRGKHSDGKTAVAYCNDPGVVAKSSRTIIYNINDKLRTKFADNKIEKVPEGVEIQYRCEDGFEIFGNSSITCLSTGTWSYPPPECCLLVPDGDSLRCIHL